MNAPVIGWPVDRFVTVPSMAPVAVDRPKSTTIVAPQKIVTSRDCEMKPSAEAVTVTWVGELLLPTVSPVSRNPPSAFVIADLPPAVTVAPAIGCWFVASTTTPAMVAPWHTGIRSKFSVVI